MTAWKQITDFPMYDVSDDGRVRSRYRTQKQLSPGVTSRGYHSVVLCEGGRKSNQLVHRLVALAFIKRSSDTALEVNHKNGVKTDNRAANLEWTTRSQNEKHSYAALGKKPNRKTKLTLTEVEAIVGDTRPQNEIAADYGVVPSLISLIKSGKRWTSYISRAESA